MNFEDEVEFWGLKFKGRGFGKTEGRESPNPSYLKEGNMLKLGR